MIYKSKRAITDAVLPLVDGQASPPKVGGGFRSEGAPLEATGAAAAPKPSAAAQAGLSQIRTLSLRLPSPSPLLPFEKGERLPSERYRTLRTKLSHHPKQPHLIVISSP